jgi:hypothetical protein
MFTPEERACLRSSLLELARNDQRITGAAITGSAAASREDRWSDVDLAFVVDTEFRALAPTFRLMFGKANEPRHVSAPLPAAIIGLAWLYALHARTCIARRKLWQAEYMISGVRDNALALACIRHGLSSVHGRGIDLLPGEVTAQFQDSLVRQLDTGELSRAFRVVIHGLVHEIASVDKELAERLQEVPTALSES